MKQRNLFAIMTIIAFLMFIFTMVFLINAIENNNKIDPLELEAMTHEQIIQRVYESQNNLSLSFLLPIFGFFGVFIGALVYFLMSDNNFKALQSSNLDNHKENNSVMLSMNVLRRALSHDERKVFDLLISRNGMLMQSEISSINGFNKVKAHRIIDQLEQKGIITKTNAGKQRVIRFTNELEVALPKKEDGFKESYDGFNK
jgi:predicted transcriptional regulator